MSMTLAGRRGVTVCITDEAGALAAVDEADLQALEFSDRVYRCLCTLLYNYVPGSGHPGGSISSGRMAQAIVFDALDYDLGQPDRVDADTLVYAAGHKALGLYSLWALRNEIARAGAPTLLPKDWHAQLRLEDLLGFRRNPVQATPLFKKFQARALDGHPTPATPFVRLSTGASGVGLAAATGLALGMLDVYRDDPPQVHVIEGEGGLTPGRVAEALACAGTLGLRNLTLHVDWNQASIDSNRVCREGGTPGDYVQWDPAELAALHDWNVVVVPDGKDFRQVLAAQRRAREIRNTQPTAIVYRTVKGWNYGIEGRASHGAGHKLCDNGFFTALAPLLGDRLARLPRCPGDHQRCGGKDAGVLEECYWEALQVVRDTLAKGGAPVARLADRLTAARRRLDQRARTPRGDAPRVEKVFTPSALDPAHTPAELRLEPGARLTLREALGNALLHLNRLSGGAFLTASADLMGSTSVAAIGKGFGEGFLRFPDNPNSRLLACGGICEDAMAGVLSGLSTYGRHVGVGSSYGAFLAALGHIAARLHGIGNQAARALKPDEPFKPFVLVCAHAGLKTGEDGPTHADPQALQLLAENFPRGVLVTLTPWEPQEVWPLLAAALARRPAVLAPFVTRPVETVPDRARLGLAPAAAAATGVYALRRADPGRPRDGTVVLQESGVTCAFVEGALPLIDQAGFNLNLFYVASAELFDLLPREEQERIFPEELGREALGITGFTLPTMYRWILSAEGRAQTLHPFRHGHYLGSGQAAAVLREAGLDGASQFAAVRDYVRRRAGA